MTYKRIVLVASKTGYQTRAFDEAAKRFGVELVMATDRCDRLDDPWGDRAIALKFARPENAANAIVAQAGPVDGIVAVGDRPAHIAALAAEALGIPFSPPQAVAACRNKFAARERFRAAGLPVPSYRLLPVAQDPRETARASAYPCVLKPLGLSASRGVIRADSEPEFIAAFERIRALLATPDIVRMNEEQNRYVQVESYIRGREFAVEAMLTCGRLDLLAIFDKPDPLEGPFFEETLYVTPSRAPAEIQAELVAATERAVRALGLTHGPMHAELRWNDGGAWPLEIAARPIGGLCARALRFDGGLGLEELILLHALGEDTGRMRREACASGVMMIPIPKNGVYHGVSGVASALEVESIEQVEITAKEGQQLVRLPEGSSYLGFLFARSGTPQAAEDALRRAHGRLEFYIATELELVASGRRNATARGGAISYREEGFPTES